MDLNIRISRPEVVHHNNKEEKENESRVLDGASVNMKEICGQPQDLTLFNHAGVSYFLPSHIYLF